MNDNRSSTHNVRDLLTAQRQVAIIWTINDVLSERPDLSDDQAWAVLLECIAVHDCDDGFTWNLIAVVADRLWGVPISPSNE